MSWDKDGAVLATTTGQNSTVVFWEAGTKKVDITEMAPGSKCVFYGLPSASELFLQCVTKRLQYIIKLSKISTTYFLARPPVAIIKK